MSQAGRPRKEGRETVTDVRQTSRPSQTPLSPGHPPLASHLAPRRRGLTSGRPDVNPQEAEAQDRKATHDPGPAPTHLLPSSEPARTTSRENYRCPGGRNHLSPNTPFHPHRPASNSFSHAQIDPAHPSSAVVGAGFLLTRWKGKARNRQQSWHDQNPHPFPLPPRRKKEKK